MRRKIVFACCVAKQVGANQFKFKNDRRRQSFYLTRVNSGKLKRCLLRGPNLNDRIWTSTKPSKEAKGAFINVTESLGKVCKNWAGPLAFLFLLSVLFSFVYFDYWRNWRFVKRSKINSSYGHTLWARAEGYLYKPTELRVNKPSLFIVFCFLAWSPNSVTLIWSTE